MKFLVKNSPGYCAFCKEERELPQTIFVPRDDFGKVPFIACRVCNRKIIPRVGEEDEINDGDRLPIR